VAALKWVLWCNSGNKTAFGESFMAFLELLKTLLISLTGELFWEWYFIVNSLAVLTTDLFTESKTLSTVVAGLIFINEAPSSFSGSLGLNKKPFLYRSKGSDSKNE